MAHAAGLDWPVGEIVVLPHAWRDDGLWKDIQTLTQDRIGSSLQEIYADVLVQPLSPCLAELVVRIAG